jgi:hypothetical protein
MTAKAYKFTHKGKSYSVPTFDQLPMGVIRKSRKGVDDMDKAFIVIEEIMGEGSPELAALDSMNPSEFEAFLNGWTQGSSVGESLGS